MKHTKCLALILTLSLILSGCSSAAASGAGEDSMSSDDAASVSSDAVSMLDTETLFTDRDSRTEYSEADCVRISLNGSSAECVSKAVSISGSVVTIREEGMYLLSGSLDNGTVIVDADSKAKVQLILDGVDIYSESYAAVYVRQADKVFITTAKNSENSLSCGDEYVQTDSNNVDAAIFSKDDLTLNGEGKLSINSIGGHGIVSKDELTITGGELCIVCARHGMTANDSIQISGGEIEINSGKDGIRTSNSGDESLGYIYICGGSFDISAEGDGISASGLIEIAGGEFSLLCGGGYENGAKPRSDGFGQFGGGRGGFGGMGGTDVPMGGGQRMPGGMNGNGSRGDMGAEDKAGRPDMTGGIDSTSGPDIVSQATYTAGDSAAEDSTTESSTSMKGIKSKQSLIISGGNFTIDSADDALHSNKDVNIYGGIFEISTGDDGIHADSSLTVNSGKINISQSYEGLESVSIVINGGEITLCASDDGLNAAGGVDGSGMGGRDSASFGGAWGGSASNASLVISGGTIDIKAYGDGIDSNGTLEISGGYISICGPTQGDTSTIDYERSGIISGGTFIGTGASSMAQSFSDSEQGVIAVNAGSNSAGTGITIEDAAGNVILSHEPELDFCVIIFSSPDIAKGETYTLTVGANSATVTAK